MDHVSCPGGKRRKDGVDQQQVGAMSARSPPGNGCAAPACGNDGYRLGGTPMRQRLHAPPPTTSHEPPLPHMTYDSGFMSRENEGTSGTVKWTMEPTRHGAPYGTGRPPPALPPTSSPEYAAPPAHGIRNGLHVPMGVQRGNREVDSLRRCGRLPSRAGADETFQGRRPRSLCARRTVVAGRADWS
jgi:hypothetical protein